MVVAPADAGTFEEQRYSEKYSCPFDGYTIDELEPRSFSFNSPHGACPDCTGLGRAHGVRCRARHQPTALDLAGRAAALVADDDDRLVVRQGRRGGCQAPGLLGRRAARRAAQGSTSTSCSTRRAARRCASATARPTATPTTTRRPSRGCCPTCAGATARRNRSGSRRSSRSYMVARPCPTCGGTRLKPEALSVTVDGLNIAQVSAAVGHRGAALGGCAAQPSQRARAPDRPPGAQGDPRPARLPGRRRARLPDHRPHLVDAVGRRGAAHPPGDADRLVADGRAVHPRRADDRPAPEGQRQADRHPRAAARPGQHADRRRARRGDDPNGRLGARHRPRRGRARRRGDRLGPHRGDPGASRARSPAHTCAASCQCPCRSNAERGVARRSWSAARGPTT